MVVGGDENERHSLTGSEELLRRKKLLRRGVGNARALARVEAPVVAERVDDAVRHEDAPLLLVARPALHLALPDVPLGVERDHAGRRLLERESRLPRRVLAALLLRLLVENGGPPRCERALRETRRQLVQLTGHNGVQLLRGGENSLPLRDGLLQLLLLFDERLVLQPDETGKAHLEDRLSLENREAESIDKPGLRFGDALRGAYQRDDLVENIERLQQPLDDVQPRLVALQTELGPSPDDLAPVADEAVEDILERHRPRRAPREREQVAAEGAGELRGRVHQRLHGLGIGFLLHLHDHPVARPVGLVPDGHDPLDVLLVELLGDLRDDARLRGAVRNFRDHNEVAVLRFFYMRLSAKRELAAPRLVHLSDTGRPDDLAPRGEVGPGHPRRRLGDAPRAAVPKVLREQRERLDGVVRRDVRRHTDRYSRRSVDQQVRKNGGKDGGLGERLVEVRDEVHRLLVDIGVHQLSLWRQADLRVAHRRGRVAVERAEVSLSVHERDAEREVLRHARHGLVYRGVAVRMVLAHRLADDPRRLFVRSPGGEAELLHRVENAALNRFQTVSGVRERAVGDDRHRVGEIAFFEFVVEPSFEYIFRHGWSPCS